MYADDIILLSSSSNGLQEKIDIFSKYCKDWCLNVNTLKTKIMIFNNAGKFHNIDFNLNGVRLECVSRYKNLGVCFCLSGSFTYTQEDLYNKSLKAYFKFSKEFLSLNQIFILVCMYLSIQLNPYCYMGVKYGVLSIHSPLNLEKVLILLIWNKFTPSYIQKKCIKHFANTYLEFMKKPQIWQCYQNW
jgi:hypothetical protein